MRLLAIAGARAPGGVVHSSSRWRVACAISDTARSKTSRFAADGDRVPLTLRTNCKAAAVTSSSVAGSSPRNVTMLRHMTRSSRSSSEQVSPTVDHEGLARDPAAGIAAQEQGDRRAVVLGIADSRDRLALAELHRDFVAPRHRALRPRATAGADDVPDDPVGAPLLDRGPADGPDRL